MEKIIAAFKMASSSSKLPDLALQQLSYCEQRCALTGEHQISAQHEWDSEFLYKNWIM